MHDKVFEKIFLQEMPMVEERVPSELFRSYQSKPAGEPPIDKWDAENVCESLKSLKCSRILVDAL